MRLALPLVLASLLAAPAGGQDAPASAADVEGVWEMVEAAGVPYRDSLVFARLTITPDEVQTVTVFRDPDDGELIGQVERARYVVSDGQLVVRDGRSTTVLAARREADRLEVLDLETGVLLRLRAADSGDALDPALVGAWHGRRDGRPVVLRFGPDGSVSVQEEGGEPDTDAYVVAGPFLLFGGGPFGDEPVRYAVEAGGRLVLTSGAGRAEFLYADH